MKKTITLKSANMRQAANWENPDQLRQYLVQCLKEGRLALVLGAGVSIGCKLPCWSELIKRLFAGEGKAVPVHEAKPSMQAQIFFEDYCGKNRNMLARKTHKALYDGYKTDAAALAEIKLLTALGALLMGSRRGSVTSVITFNFDDLLEVYLSYFGYVVASIDQLPIWSRHADVDIYHPHGLLSARKPVSNEAQILMTEADFDQEANNAGSLWKSKMRDILCSHVCLFIGLSGDDNLMKLLEFAQGQHVSNELKHPYWGVRFSTDAKDPKRRQWESKKIAQWTLPDWKDLPNELFKICQMAAEQ